MKKSGFLVALLILMAVGWSATGYVFFTTDKDKTSKIVVLEDKVAALSIEGLTLKGQLSQAQDKRDELVIKLTETEAKRSEVTEKLASTQTALQEEITKLPISIKFRSAMFGAGQVMMLRNDSEKYLTLSIYILNTTTGKSGKFQPQLQPHTTLEIGHLEGWKFSSGDQIVIDSSGFSTATLLAP